MHAYVLTVDFLSSGVQVARHGHHRRFTGYALPTARGLTCGDGQLVDCLRCVAVRVGQALLYQQFGDLFAVARRFRASRRAAACGRLQTAETGTFRHVRSKHGAYEFLGPPHTPGGCPVPRGTEN